MRAAVTDSQRWSISFAVIVVLHAVLFWLALRWLPNVPVQPPEPPPILIDLPPPPLPPQRVVPHQVLREPVAQPIVPRAPAPHIAVPLPPKPPARERRVVAAPAPVVPENVPTPAATAPPQAEAPPQAPALAATPPPVPAPPSNAGPAWSNQLLGRLERFKRYPAGAQRRHQQGVAFLRFTMDRRGNVLSASISQSSGFPDLDDEALALIRRAQPLPPPPLQVPGDPVELVVPIQFFLKP